MSIFDRFKKSPSDPAMQSSCRKAVVLGLDGVPYTLLRRFIDDGTMPNLASIAKEGTLFQMDSSLPEVSSVAWTSFATGVNPAVHGIYGFMDLRPGTYKMYFPNSKDIKADTIWDVAGRAGKRSVVINLPHTYPAKEIDGVLVAGFVAIDLKKATYPEAAYNYLNNMGYRIDVDARKARESIDNLVEDINLTFDKRKEAVLHYFDQEPWDLFIATVTETDRLHHFMWDALDDENHKYSGFFKDFYREIDGLIGDIYDRCSGLTPKPRFMMLSDHGFTGIEQEVYINFWLRENGYLAFENEPAKSTEDIGYNTKAFALDPSRVYINTVERYPNGSVNNGSEYEDIREELADRLMATGIIQSVYKREEIYSGPLLDNAPDLVLLSKAGYDLKGAISKDVFMAKDKLRGMHTHDDAMFFVNEAIEREGRLKISDIARFVSQVLK